MSRTFGADEVIVSKTDLKGRLTYVNDVFLRVSRYPEEELLGRPHNVIRHPNMPRALFAMLWTEIQAGREMFAYIDNLAADGENYWVFAHVTPTVRNGAIIGYHSNRRVPSAHAIAEIVPLYAEMCAIEQRYSHPRQAMDASAAYLAGELDRRRMTYDQFVWSITEAGQKRVAA